MKLRPALKIIARIFLGLLLLVGLFYAWSAWAIFVNRYDEPLTPEAEAMLAYRPQELPDAENGYVAMVGFTAPTGSDWKKVGAELIARNNEHVRVSGRFDETKAAAKEEAQKIKFSECDGCEGMVKLSGNNNEAALLVSLRSLPQQKEQINKLLAHNAELIRRYEEIQSASAFSETMLISLTSVFPDYSDIRLTQQLLLSRAALAALAGNREPLLNFLERDLAFWRLVMRSDTSLVTAMAANAFISQDLRLLRALLTKINFSAPELERLRYLLTPLSAEEQSLLRALENEWNRMAEVAPHTAEKYSISIENDSSIFRNKSFLQPQATVNLYAEKIRPLRELASLPSPEFVARRSIADTEEEYGIGLKDLILTPYNFVGRLIVAIAAPDYGAYIGRNHDLAAALQLTRAVLELRIAGIDAGNNPDAVPEFLKQAGKETLNPYTGMPFEWDETCRRLCFTPQGADHSNFFAVTLADIPEENTAACAAL
ncbi:MAG: hypothetical protein FWG81_06950 [Betaproteobacteria bacterium]|nr:hypothetical protein [Betaproteobacteria bacterium]